MGVASGLLLSFHADRWWNVYCPIWSSSTAPCRSLMIIPDSYSVSLRSFESPWCVSITLRHGITEPHWHLEAIPVLFFQHYVRMLLKLVVMGVVMGILIICRHLPKKQAFFSLRFSKMICSFCYFPSVDSALNGRFFSSAHICSPCDSFPSPNAEHFYLGGHIGKFLLVHKLLNIKV